MANYNVDIVNGSGSKRMETGTYNVTVQSDYGYDLLTLNPKTFTATAEGATGTFELSANGTLTFIVNETGASGGTTITSGSIIMTDSTGNTQYGEVKQIGPTGECEFANVPYGSSEEPLTLYFKQLSTDSEHSIYDGVISISLTSSTQTEYIKNDLLPTQNFTLTDANYSGLPVTTATLTLSGN